MKKLNYIIIKSAICVAIIILVISCNNKPNELKYIVGDWVLDSSSYHDGSFRHEKACSFLNFENETDFRQYYDCGCVHTDFKGKYFILNNPNRGLKTITLIPDSYVDNQDTIRADYINFDIVSLNNERLEIVKATEFINNDNLPLTVFNEIEIYKKVKK